MKGLVRKITGVSMAAVVLSISLTGCGASKSESADAGSGTKTDFTYGMTTSSAWSDRYDSYADLPLGKALQEKTGVTLNMVHVKDNTAMNLVIASGELPDIIGFNFKANYQGGEQKAVQDQVIYGMTEDFVKENAPDYWNAISSDPDILKQVKTPDGLIAGFSFILGDELLKTGKGLIIRDDWCRDLGIEEPQTPDEYYNMLKLFKEKEGAEVPLSVATGTIEEMLSCGMITSPFGLPTTDNYIENGKVTAGYAQPQYKEVLQWLHKLYDDGLLDPNFSTLDSATTTANILTGKCGATAGAAGSALGTWLQTNDGQDYSLAGIRGLVAKKGDIPMYSHYNNTVTGGITAISTSCEDKAAAAKFLNYGYTEEGHTLYNFGIEGESYTEKNDEPVYTDLILHNPDGLSVKQALSEYSLAYGNGPFVQDKDYLLQYYSYDAQKKALENWSVSDVKNYKLPTLTIAADSMSEYTSLTSDIKTYRQEMLVKFIKGTESLDNFDEYLATLDKMGQKRVMEIQQAAYEEYQKR